MMKFTRDHYACAHVMSLLVDSYRKAVTTHATIAKRKEAYQLARDFYLAQQERRKLSASWKEEDPFLI